MNISQSEEIKRLKEKLHFAETRNIRLESELKKYQQQSNLNKYFQFFNRYQKLLRGILNKNKKAFALLLFFCENMDKNNIFHITQEELSKILNVSDRYIRQSINLLKEHKIIKVVEEGRSNYYIINSKIAWKSSLENKQYSKFSANPVLLDITTEKAFKKIIKTTTQATKSSLDS